MNIAPPTLPSHAPRWPLDRADGGYTITDPATGRVRHFADRAEVAVLEQVDDRNGQWLTFEYDAEGVPLAIVSSGGHHLKITTRDERVIALHLASAAVDGSDQEIKHYVYSDDGHLTEVINSSGLPLQFTYDERGRITSWTDTNDRSYTYEYDEKGRCVAEGGAEGHMSLRLSYDETDPGTGHHITTTTTTTGEGTRRYLINSAFQVVAEIDPLGNVTQFERDRHNRLLSRTDPLGHTARYEYDDRGNLTRAVRVDGREIRAHYNEQDLPAKVIPCSREPAQCAFGRIECGLHPLGLLTQPRHLFPDVLFPGLQQTEHRVLP
ncbi:RHS repeat domain-containing protein [Streptomyces sp. NPDC005279]|uniref:RHS repeat domain-containing protein n=1 Tax=Streptomyces sp. NPDC005279 TaxID=3364712 RepID=UPI00369896A1